MSPVINGKYYASYSDPAYKAAYAALHQQLLYGQINQGQFAYATGQVVSGRGELTNQPVQPAFEAQENIGLDPAARMAEIQTVESMNLAGQLSGQQQAAIEAQKRLEQAGVLNNQGQVNMVLAATIANDQVRKDLTTIGVSKEDIKTVREKMAANAAAIDAQQQVAALVQRGDIIEIGGGIVETKYRGARKRRLKLY